MRTSLSIFTAAIVIAASGIPILAHHSIANEYDATKATTIQGMITRMEWINPHAWIYMNAKDSNGTITAWRVQIAAVGALTKANLDKNMIDLSKSYTMEIWPAFDGSKHASGRTLTFADGRTFDVSDKFPQNPKVK